MAIARTEEFSQKEIDVADFAKALSHPARVAILTTLARKRECICGELVTDLPLAQSTVSQHLRALKEFGIIKGTIDGPRSRYCIDWKVLEKYEKHLQEWSKNLFSYKHDNKC